MKKKRINGNISPPSNEHFISSKGATIFRKRHNQEIARTGDKRPRKNICAQWRRQAL